MATLPFAPMGFRFAQPTRSDTQALTAADLDPGPRGPYRFVGTLEQTDAGNLVRTPDGGQRLLDPAVEVMDRTTGQVYQRREAPPPNPEAARAAEGVNILGKLAGAAGLDDPQGTRAGTPWSQALANTFGSLSLANTAQSAMSAADRLMTEAPAGRQDPTLPLLGFELGGAVGMGAAPTAMAGGMPKGALGTFASRIHAENLLKREGNPVPLEAINMAERLERSGAPYADINRTVNEYIQSTDSSLGPLYKPAEHQGLPGGWMVELPNNETLARSNLPEQTTLGEALIDPRLYRASPDSERMPVLSGRAADRAAAENKLPGMASGEARYLPTGERGHGYMEMGTEVDQPRLALLHELQHHFDREAGLAAGTNPGAVGRARYDTNIAEVRANLVEQRSTMDASRLHRLPPEMHERMMVERAQQNMDASHPPLPIGGRPVAVRDVARWLREAGATNITQQAKGKSGTAYIKFDDPDNPRPTVPDAPLGMNVAPKPYVRIPLDSREHTGRLATPEERAVPGTYLDTAMSPRGSISLRNITGGPYSTWDNLVAAMKWRLSRAPDGQFLISPDDAPQPRPHRVDLNAPPPERPVSDPSQGVLPLEGAPLAAPFGIPNIMKGGALRRETPIRPELYLHHGKPARGLQYFPDHRILQYQAAAGNGSWRVVHEFSPAQLAEYLGPDLAQRLLAQPLAKSPNAVGQSYQLTDLSGVRLGEYLDAQRARAAEQAERATVQSQRDREWDAAAPPTGEQTKGGARSGERQFAPMDIRSPILSHPEIQPLIVTLRATRPQPSNAAIAQTIKERTGVYVTPGQVRAYVDRRLLSGSAPLGVPHWSEDQPRNGKGQFTPAPREAQ